MYESEHVPVENIVFVDNQLCLDLIEKKSGSILAMLDEELVMPKVSPLQQNNPQLCLVVFFVESVFVELLNRTIVVTQATDATFVSKLHSNFGGKHGAEGSGHAHYRKLVQKPDAFVVVHFAGEVEYTSKGCLEKNKVGTARDRIFPTVFIILFCRTI
jgi:myosin heavy subunit